MKTFKQTDTNLHELRAGDVLELADGTRHEAVKGSSSVLLNGGCNAHFWVRNGEIIFC